MREPTSTPIIMFGSFLPSLWSSTNQSVLGSREPTRLCNQVEIAGRALPSTTLDIPSAARENDAAPPALPSSTAHAWSQHHRRRPPRDYQEFNAIDKFVSLSDNKPPYSRQFFGGSIGGPIVKEKLFGFFAFERQREHTSFAESPDALTQLTAANGAGLAAEPSAIIATPFFENRYNGRLDYKFSDGETAYISYTSQANNSLNDQSDGTGDLTEGNFTKNHLQVANFTLGSVLTDTLVNSFTFGYQFWNNIIDSTQRVPRVTFPGGTNGNVQQQSYQRKFQFRDDVTKTMGRHTFAAGINYIFNPKLGDFFEVNSTLELDFGADPTAILANAGGRYPQGLATPGAVVSMSASSGNPYFDMPGGTKQLGVVFQDDWKAAKRLTLNLGLRRDKDFNLIGASAIQKSRTYQELLAIGSPYAKLPHDDDKDFSPRIGFAYDLTGQSRHVLRGGYGLYYGDVFQNIPLLMIQQSNPTIYQGVLSITTPADTVLGTGILLGNWRYGVDPFPVIPPPLTSLVAGATGRLMDPKYRNPVSQQFNFGYQWAVSSKSVKIKQPAAHHAFAHLAHVMKPYIPGPAPWRVNVCVKPPILKWRSSTSTRHLRNFAMMLANASPPIPEPITIASYPDCDDMRFASVLHQTACIV
jgi:hypothetical protein